ncbi:hypothetical protein [Luteimonas sp. TWI1416]|uniref:hypothetical protein n=1 Tax=unclassified Luteimonas TaxID=2629088 RepID=UPI00320A74CF
MSKPGPAPQSPAADAPGSYRLLSRQLARDLTDSEIDAVAGGTTSRTQLSAQVSAQIIVVDDADA